MVSNTLLTIDTITNEALIVLQNKMAFGNRVLRKYDDSFGVEGAKTGDTIRIRKPIRVTVRSGASASAQNTKETSVTLTLDTQKGIDLSWTTKEAALQIDDFSDRILKPMMAQLASTIDADGMTLVKTGAQSLATVGAISSTVGPAAWTGADVSTILPLNDAQARVIEQSGPVEDNYIILSTGANAAMVNTTNSLFNPNQVISTQYTKGIFGNYAGADVYSSPNVPQFTAGAWTQAAGCKVAVTSTSGDVTLAVKGFGAGDTILKGDQCVITSCFAVNPLNRVTTGKLQVFTVLADGVNDGAGNFTLSIFPAATSSGQYQTVNSLPTLNKLITMMGTSGATTALNLYYNKNAFALGVASLDDVSRLGAECYVAVDPVDGMSMRLVRQYTASDDQEVTRMDVLYGWVATRPELACRICA